MRQSKLTDIFNIINKHEKLELEIDEKYCCCWVRIRYDSKRKRLVEKK